MQKTSVLFHFCKSPLAPQLAHALIICRLGEFANPSWPRCFCCQVDSAAHHASDRRRHRVGRGRPSAPSTHGQISVPYHTPPKVSPLQFYWVRFFCERQLLYHREARARRGQQRHRTWTENSDALDNGPGRRRCCGRPRPDAVSHSAAAISLTAVRALSKEMTLAPPRPCSSPTFISRCHGFT